MIEKIEEIKKILASHSWNEGVWNVIPTQSFPEMASQICQLFEPSGKILAKQELAFRLRERIAEWLWNTYKPTIHFLDWKDSDNLSLKDCTLKEADQLLALVNEYYKNLYNK